MIFKLIEVLEEIITFAIMTIKFPLRIICKIKGEHDWKWHGGGFFFDVKYPFTCKICGCRSNGDLEDLEKKSFKGIAKIK